MHIVPQGGPNMRSKINISLKQHLDWLLDMHVNLYIAGKEGVPW